MSTTGLDPPSSPVQNYVFSSIAYDAIDDFGTQILAERRLLSQQAYRAKQEPSTPLKQRQSSEPCSSPAAPKQESNDPTFVLGPDHDEDSGGYSVRQWIEYLDEAIHKLSMSYRSLRTDCRCTELQLQYENLNKDFELLQAKLENSLAEMGLELKHAMGARHELEKVVGEQQEEIRKLKSTLGLAGHLLCG
ncbi:hypothetical protein CVT26_009684 [Gymnopilus dilepis]|uniref:Uncharacterized protein n=1 Tax=Gymnopilus dilepis TaxID=231916 RepID=A0A409YBT4_9AGAR|nr:hypothetical protein CVT26_009684 [Gymnopilus dilepis]